MASADAASASSMGPRYAPEDPTLPKPWKGLIDGSTGLLYYWNPETNVTQYDRPVSFNPPLPPGPPPVASASKIASVPIVETLSSNASATEQQKQGHLTVQQSESVVQQMPVQHSQLLPFHQAQPANQVVQQQCSQLQPNQIQYPQGSYAQGQVMGQSQGQQLQQQVSQVPYNQRQEGSQVPYQQQQEGSQFRYQQPQQQGSQVSVQQQQQQQQQLPGSQNPFRQQQQQRQGPVVPYQHQDQFQLPKFSFLIGKQSHLSQTPHELGQHCSERQENVAQQQGQQMHGLAANQQTQHIAVKQQLQQQIPASQHGQQIGFSRMEDSVQQEGKSTSLSLPHFQQSSLGPASHQLPGPTSQPQVSQVGWNPVQLPRQHFGRCSPSGQQLAGQFSGLPSGGQQLSALPLGQHFNGLTSVAQQVSIPSSSGQQYNGVSASSQHFSGLPSVGQFSGEPHGVSSTQLRPIKTETSFQHRQNSSPVASSNHVDQSVARPMALPMGDGEDWRDRRGGEFLSSSRNERTIIPTQLPKLAPLPERQTPQDMRTGPEATDPLLVSPAHSNELNLRQGFAMQRQYNHPPFPHAPPMVPPLRMFGAPELTNISGIDTYRIHHDITVMGTNIPAPFMTFEATGFPPEIVREMHSAGFLSPTPIQAQTWPVAVQNRDIVTIAKTASGKTLGFLIPAFILVRHFRNNPQFGPTVLVLAPTRELATQIQDEAIKFGRSSRVTCACLYGGALKGPQLREIEQGADIVVATPDQLNDILDMGKINLHQVSLFVLDEADRMLDMGFEPQIHKIVNVIPKQRQTLMYTATWPKEVRKMAVDILVDPVQVNIGNTDELLANKSITQYVEVLSPEDKRRRLDQILRSHEPGAKVIIFCATMRQCDQLARGLGRTFGAVSVHGDKSQDERDQALNQFRYGRASVLVATDIAARGLDIKDIRVVINYDFPSTIEDYVHRVGRTGRAGASGVSYTFFSHQDWKYAADLITVLEGADQRVPSEVREMAARGCPPAFSRTLSHGGKSRWDSSGGGRWAPDDGRGNGQRELDGGQGSGIRDFGAGRGVGGRGGVGGRNVFYSGQGGMRGQGFDGPSSSTVSGGWGRHGRIPHDRYGRGRSDGGGQRGYGERRRDRSYSRSPDRVRSRGYGRHRLSRSQSWSRSRSRSRSRSQTRSRSRSRSWTRSRSRSRSRSYEKYDRPRRKSLFSDAPNLPVEAKPNPPVVPGFDDVPLSGDLSPMSPGKDNGSFPRNEFLDQVPAAGITFATSETGPQPGK